MILNADTREVRLGGAASVAFLAGGLDAEVAVAGIVGDDAAGGVVRSLFDEAGIKQAAVISDPARRTTVKERFVGRAANRRPHQILRVDHEICRPIDPELERRLAESIVARLGEYQALLISDYGKGVCTPRLVKAAISAAVSIRLPVIVDPSQNANYACYRHATILTPNRAEAETATRRTIRTHQAAIVAGQQLCQECCAEAVLVTLDSEGMAIIRADGSGEMISTRPRAVCDVTGAGDMVLAMTGVCQAMKVPLTETARLANTAAGLEVEKLGIVPVGREEIEAELERTSRKKPRKPIGLGEMVALARSYRQSGKTIVLTSGCFDLLHVGHADCLQEAAGLGDVLVVAVNSDQSVSKAKGPDRPVIKQQDRATLLASFHAVDHVLLFDDDTPHELLRQIRPDVLVKGGTYTAEEVVGREIVQSYGGNVCVVGKRDDISTSQIITSMRDGTKTCNCCNSGNCRQACRSTKSQK